MEINHKLEIEISEIAEKLESLYKALTWRHPFKYFEIVKEIEFLEERKRDMVRAMIINIYIANKKGE